MSLTIDPARLFRWQCSLVAAVILTHLVLGLIGVLAGHDRVLGVARLFDVRHEGNVPTFLSAVVLLATAITAGAISCACRAGAQHAGTWTWIAAALLFAAFDEAAQIHELLSGPLRQALGARGPLYFAWILPYGAAVVLGSLLAFPALMALGAAATRWVSLGVVLAFAGAIGVEMVQGVLWTRNGPASSASLLNFALATLEEIFELLGSACILRGLLVGLATLVGGPPLRVVLAAGRSAARESGSPERAASCSGRNADGGSRTAATSG